MFDNRYDILAALVTRLTPIGLPVYSVVPQDMSQPYIYIGDLFFEELPDKDGFLLGGMLTVELLTGSNEWLGSIEQPLKWYNDIKLALKPYKKFVLIDKMIYMRMDLDTGLEQLTPTDRIYAATLQYEFQLLQSKPWHDVVCEYVKRVQLDGGTVEAVACLDPECAGHLPTYPPLDGVTHLGILVYNENELVTHNN